MSPLWHMKLDHCLLKTCFSLGLFPSSFSSASLHATHQQHHLLWTVFATQVHQREFWPCWSWLHYRTGTTTKPNHLSLFLGSGGCLSAWGLLLPVIRGSISPLFWYTPSSTFLVYQQISHKFLSTGHHVQIIQGHQGNSLNNLNDILM